MTTRKNVIKCVLELMAIGLIVAGTIATILTRTVEARSKRDVETSIIETVSDWEMMVLAARLAAENNDLPEAEMKAAEEVKKVEAPVMDRFYTDADAHLLARIIEAEYGGCHSDTERSGVGWTVLNRVDHPDFPNTIQEVIYEPDQFAVEYMDAEVVPDILKLSYDILERWNNEQNGAANVGRTLPRESIYFYGDGVRNYFNDGHNTFVPDPTVYNN